MYPLVFLLILFCAAGYAALRQSGVLAAPVIGSVFFKEPLPMPRSPAR